MSTQKYDSDVVLAAQAGDEQAISLLLRQVQPDIRRYAQLNCQLSDVNDAVQETLWLIYRRIETLRAINSFSAWLFSIVRRECWRLKKQLSGQSFHIDELSDDERLLYMPQEDLRRDIAKAIQSLPDNYREIILLRDIREMTIDEIAVNLQQTRESVKGKLHRARLMLREYLRD